MNDDTIAVITDSLVCPITEELPIDPVMATDGYVYERWAIEKHIRLNCNNELRSPVTNGRIADTKLVSAAQTKGVHDGPFQGIPVAVW